ncbi:MAG: argininosuccinate lyase [Anaerolineae bacterium]|nr:argininosuccinate lyase [Anaerolineae bacterium]
MWGGRFTGDVDELMERFNASFPFDRRLYREDIEGSLAYARALEQAGVLSDAERVSIERGLRQVLTEFEQGTFVERPGDEDIHTAVERRLRELAGPIAGKLHTGRSRNDQVATDLRLYLRRQLDERSQELHRLQRASLDLAERNRAVIMPGYTHMQRAQPVRFSHWVLSWFWAWQRDMERLNDCRARAEVMPLGSGALAGTPLRLDREALASDLGFARPSENSMDAVRDRDFVVEALSWAAILSVHLSQMAEDVIIWSSAEFGFVRVADAYSTGSSLMPQKRNPDSLELIRGKAGRMIGHLTGLLTTLKGLPSTYNKDLQEDKEALFDAMDNLALTVPVATGVLETLEVCPDRMRAALDEAMLATDLADYLVAKGMPFRQAHEVVGRAVRLTEERGKDLSRLGQEEWASLSPLVGADVRDVFSWERSVEARSALGGTGLAALEEQLRRAHAALDVSAHER